MKSLWLSLNSTNLLTPSDPYNGIQQLFVYIICLAIQPERNEILIVLYLCQVLNIVLKFVSNKIYFGIFFSLKKNVHVLHFFHFIHEFKVIIFASQVYDMFFFKSYTWLAKMESNSKSNQCLNFFLYIQTLSISL